MVANAGIKVLALFVSFLSTPMMMSYFSNDGVLGAWFTILSVLNWISFFDFGIGNGMRNDLTYALNEEDWEKARVVVSSSFFVLGAVVLALMPLGALAASFVDWNSVLAVDHVVLGNDALSACMMVVILGTLVQLILKLVNALLYAVQKNATPALILLISNCLILIAVAFPPSLTGTGEKLMYMCLVEMIALSAPLIVAAVILFATTYKECIPTIRDVRSSYFSALGLLGFQFFVIQIALLFVSSTNELFIGSLCGSGSVVPYSVAYRVFNLILVFFGVMAQPIWSDMACSYAGGNWSRLISVYKNYRIIAVVASVGALFIGVMINPVLKIWLGGQAPALTFIETVSFVFLVAVTVLTNAETCLGNATNRLQPQVSFFTFAAIAKYPLSVGISILVPDWASVVIANGIVLLPVLVFQHADNHRLISNVGEVSIESK